MIKRYVCHSNNDDLKRLEWPDDFVFPPREGDRVESLCGRKVAKVYTVTHGMVKRDGEKYPIVAVELNF